MGLDEFHLIGLRVIMKIHPNMFKLTMLDLMFGFSSAW